MVAGITTSLLTPGAGAWTQPYVQVRDWAATCPTRPDTGGHAAAPETIPVAGMARSDGIYEKLLAHKGGDKPSAVMRQITRGFSDEQISALANRFATQKFRQPKSRRLDPKCKSGVAAMVRAFRGQVGELYGVAGK